jgi:hypothetical protein
MLGASAPAVDAVPCGLGSAPLLTCGVKLCRASIVCG